MSGVSSGSGVLIRAVDDTLFYVSMDNLLSLYKLSDEQQKGSPEGDALIASLDRCATSVGVKNCVLAENMTDQEVMATSPSGGKEKFSIATLDQFAFGSPRSGKEKYSPSAD